MALTPVAVEFGMGTDLQGGDHTKAAIRALKDALWHNSLNMADAFGFPREAMQVHVKVSEDGSKFTVIANVAATVSFDMEAAT